MKKQYRVKKSKDIENILKNHQFTGNSYFTLYYKENNETNHFRYAMSVGKKIGNAVVRNHLKRQIRAIVRKLDVICHMDIFIVVKTRVLELEFNDLQKELIILFKRKNLLTEGENNDSIY